MTQFNETYTGMDKHILTKEELEDRFKEALQDGWHGEGQIESIQSNFNLTKLTNVFTSFIVSRALAGDRQAVTALLNTVYDVEVVDDN